MTEPMHVLNQINVLDHGYVKLLNVTGPMRRADVVEGPWDTFHVDQDFDGDDIDPALVARTSFDGDDFDVVTGEIRTREQELKLVKYLMDHKHTTPLEFIDIHLMMKLPIFVARQLVRHRTVSINEVSARYVQLDNDFYIPEPGNVGNKSASSKQGRDIQVSPGNDMSAAHDFVDALEEHCEMSYSHYEDAIREGIPNELARMFLPVNIYTRWTWKQNLHNLMHMLRLRMDPHAQWEIRQYAEAIHGLVSEQLPVLMEYFDDQIINQKAADEIVADFKKKMEGYST